jgi:hypothetical protein
VHKKIDGIIQYIKSDLRYYLFSEQKNTRMIKDSGLQIPEADARQIAAYAKRDVDRLSFLSHFSHLPIFLLKLDIL